VAANLSELLLSVRMNRGALGRITLRRDAEVVVPRVGRTAAYFVLSGQVQAQSDVGGGLLLGPGDFLCFSSGAAHRLIGSSPTVKSRLNINDFGLADEPARINCGEGPVECEILVGVFGLANQLARPMQTTLPEVLIVRPNDDHCPSFVAPPAMIASFAGPGATAFGCQIIKMHFNQAVRRLHSVRDQAMETVAMQSPAIARSIRLMDGNLSHAWTVASLAQAVGISRSRFAAAFVQFVGEPPLRHLTSQRLKEAMQLARRNQLPIGEIAAEVGYRSQSSFTRAFVKHFGMTPRQVRSCTQPHPRDASLGDRTHFTTDDGKVMR